MPPSNDVMLVQCVEDVFYFGLFGQIALSLQEQQHAIKVEQYVLRSMRVGEAKSIFSFIASRMFINPLYNFKWVRLYNSFCNGVGYRSGSLQPISDVFDFYHAWICWRNLDNKKDLISLVIDDVAVGDLVNDSFLRFKPAPTVDLKDNYLLILLWQAHRDIRRAKAYFGRTKPKLYLTSYSTYTHHGIPVRVALQHGVRVFSFGNYQEFTKELTLKDFVHTKNPDAYADDFSRLNGREEKLALAESALSARMAGQIDSATAYMKKSAYAESGESVPDVRDAVVIFLHDFYDSPHVYREMVFPDFWEWLCFTIETLNSANIRFFVKPHPNQINLSETALSKLRDRYPDTQMVPSSITNKQLAEAGMACAVTVYGTVAHEMAYLGVPTIAAAHHPHISFDFCRTAESLNEYVELLRHYAEIGIDKQAMHRQSLEFYYMHNLCVTDEEKALRDAAMDFRIICDQTAKTDELVDRLQKISRLPEYRDCVSGPQKWGAIFN